MSWGLPFVTSSLTGRWTPPRSPRSATPTRSPRDRSASPRGAQLALVPAAGASRLPVRSRGITGAHYGSATGGYYGGQSGDMAEASPNYSGSWRALEDQGLTAAAPSRGRVGGGGGTGGFSPSALPAAHAGLAQTLQGMVAAEIDRARERWVLMSKRLDDAERRLTIGEERLLVAAAAALSTKERRERAKALHGKNLFSDDRGRGVGTGASEAAVKMANKRNNKVEVALVAWRLEAISAKKIRELTGRLEGVARRMSKVQDVMITKRQAVFEAADSAVRLADAHPNPAAHARLYVYTWRWACREADLQQHVEDVGKHALSVVWTARTCVQSWVKLIERNQGLWEEDEPSKELKEDQLQIASRLSYFTLRFVHKMRRQRAFTCWRMAKMKKRDGNAEFKKYVAGIMATNGMLRKLTQLFASWALILRCEKLERTLTSELEMQKSASAAEISALRRAATEGSNEKNEMMAAKYAAQQRAEHIRSIVSAWSRTAHEEALQKQQKQQEAELAKKQEEELLKAKIHYSAEVEELRKKEREAGDHTAELMADNYKKNIDRKLLSTCISDWRFAIREDLAQKALVKEQQKRQQELDELKNLHDRQGDKTAEMMAKKYREERERDSLNRVWRSWSAGISEKLVQKKHAEENAKRQEEFDKLKEAYKQREEHDEHTADVVAKQYRENVLKQQKDQIFEVWSHWAATAVAELKKKEIEAIHQAQMDELKSNYADKGEKHAEMMAERYRQNREAQLKHAVWAEWYKDCQAALNEKALKEAKFHEQQALAEERARAEEQRNLELDDLKNKYRQAGDATAEKMADKMRDDRQQKFIVRLVTAWRDTVQDEISKRRLKEERAAARKMVEEAENERAAELAEARQEHEQALKDAEASRQAELEEMKKQAREAGDANAELMAVKLYEKKLLELKTRCYNAWFNSAHEQIQKKIVEQEREAMKRAKDAELEEMRSTNRQKGDATAERMAKKFNQQLQTALQLKILDEWQELVLHHKMERRLEEEREAGRELKEKEIDNLRTKHQKERDAAIKAKEDDLNKLNEEMTARGDKTAEKMAEKFRQRHFTSLQETILSNWSKRARVEAMQKDAHEELENLKAQVRKKGDETAELMAKQFHAAHLVELAQRIAGAWRRTAHAEAMESKRRAEREAIALKWSESKMVEFMSRCMNAWATEAHEWALERKNEEQAKLFDQELARLRDEYDSRQEESGEQLVQHFRRAANSKKLQRLYAVWHKEFAAGVLERKHVAELESLRAEAESGTLAISTMEKVAEKYREMLEAKLIKLCVECWEEVSSERLVEKRLEAERQKMQRRHEVEMEAQIDELRQKERAKGDATAERIADKAVQVRNEKIMDNLFGVWCTETQVRTKQRMEATYEKDVERMKRMYQGKDDRTAELMAEKFHKMHMQHFLLVCLISWAKEITEDEVDKLQLHSETLSKAQHKAEKEMKALRQDYIGKNEKTAAKLAEKFRQQHFISFMQLILDVWAHEVHLKVRDLARQKKDDQLEVLRRQERDEETAQRLAEYYRKELEQKLLDFLMGEWSRSAQKFTAQKKLEKELAALKAKERQAGDRNADLMAKHYRKSKDAMLLSKVIDEWNNQAACAEKPVALEFGVQADVLMMPAEDDRAVQTAYMKTKVEVALKEIARLESEKALLRLELVAQRRRGDGAIKRSDTVVSRAARILFVRALRATRERTFLSWVRESALSAAIRREERAEVAAQQYASPRHPPQPRSKSPRNVRFDAAAQPATDSALPTGLRVAVDGGPFRIVDVNWQYSSEYDDPNSL